MKNKIKTLREKTIGDCTVKLAEVGSGHHVISYKVITDNGRKSHEATMHDCLGEAESFYQSRLTNITKAHGANGK